MIIKKENLQNDNYIFGKLEKNKIKVLSFKPNGTIQFEILLTTTEGKVKKLVKQTSGINTTYNYAFPGYADGDISIHVFPRKEISEKEWTQLENVKFE